MVSLSTGYVNFTELSYPSYIHIMITLDIEVLNLV